MYLNGQLIFDDFHFKDHYEHGVPIQIYRGSEHSDIGFVEQFCTEYIKINNVFYKPKPIYLCFQARLLKKSKRAAPRQPSLFFIQKYVLPSSPHATSLLPPLPQPPDQQPQPP